VSTDKSTIFEGPVTPILIRLSAPIYVGMCVQVLFYIANVFWLGLIDDNSAAYIGAMGLMMPVAQILLALCNGMTVSVSTMIARAVGENDGRMVRVVASSGFLLAGAVSTSVMTVGYLFDARIIHALGARGEYFAQAREYFRYILPSALLLCVSSVCAGILQGRGRMRAVMFGLLVGTMVNMVLDPVFIWLLDLKLKGAALATSTSQLGIVAYYLSALAKRGFSEPFCSRRSPISLGAIRAVAATAAPVAFSQLAAAFSCVVYNRIIADIDLVAVTSFTLCARFDQIVLMPVSAISVSVSTLVGQNIGRRSFDRVRSIWTAALVSSYGIVFVLATAMILLAPTLYGAIQHNPTVFVYAVQQTRIMEYGFLFTATCMLANSVFQGSGTPRLMVWITLAQLFLVAIPLILCLRSIYSVDMETVWASLLIGNFVAAGLSLLWVRASLRRFEPGKANSRPALSKELSRLGDLEL
jgi:putative MATE family efflux protein